MREGAIPCIFDPLPERLSAAQVKAAAESRQNPSEDADKDSDSPAPPKKKKKTQKKGEEVNYNKLSINTYDELKRKFLENYLIPDIITNFTGSLAKFMHIVTDDKDGRPFIAYSLVVNSARTFSCFVGNRKVEAKLTSHICPYGTINSINAVPKILGVLKFLAIDEKVIKG